MKKNMVVRLGRTQWYVTVAKTLEEVSQGLNGVRAMPVGTGMLFDLGIEGPVKVTTEKMLFPIDIAFLDSDMKLIESYENAVPGLIIQPAHYARYFLEVNQFELRGI